MTKILGICGSAAPKRSTKKLIETALEAAKIAGAEVEFIDAAKMEIHGCKGCLACKKDQTKFCVQKDDMKPLYDKINAADAIIIGVLPSTLVNGFKYCGAAVIEPLIVGELHSADYMKPEVLAAAKTLGKKTCRGTKHFFEKN